MASLGQMLKRGVAGGAKAMGNYLGSEIEGERKSAREERLAKIRHEYALAENKDRFDYGQTLQQMRIDADNKRGEEAVRIGRENRNLADPAVQEVRALGMDETTPEGMAKLAEILKASRTTGDRPSARTKEINEYIRRVYGGEANIPEAERPAAYLRAAAATGTGGGRSDTASRYVREQQAIQKRDDIVPGDGRYRGEFELLRDGFKQWDEELEKHIKKETGRYRREPRSYQQPGNGREPLLPYKGATRFYNPDGL